MKQFSHIVYAGTFDRLHIGHKKLLDMAFELAEKVSIGITSDEMVKEKLLSELIQNLELRIKNLKKYLREKKYLGRASFFELKNIYGPSILDNRFDSILVTKLTKSNAEKINKIRTGKKLNPLEIIEETLVRGDDGEIISSERIRMGEIDREGKSYELLVNSYLDKGKEELILPKELREELRKPLGQVFGGSVDQLSVTAKKVIKSIKSKVPMVISVGDIVTMSMIDEGFNPDVKIIDFRSRRKEINLIESSTQFFITRESPLRFGGLSKVKKIAFASSKQINSPGTINIKTAKEIKKSIDKFIKTGKKQLIIVEGEEDLLALPAVLFASLNSIVLYGQFDMGVVMVEVTEEKKKEVKEILLKFI